MSNKWVIDESTLVEIADEVRRLSNENRTLTPSEMILLLKDIDLEEIHEAGQQAEYDRFWDSYQNKGKRTSYAFGFGGFCWSDATYNPKYPITATENANGLFQNAAYVTDTKVPIDLGTTGRNKTGMFLNASKLVTIHKLICNCDTINFSQQFTGCTALKNITFEGVIGSHFNVQWCPLTVESMKSIISCLKNHTGLDTANTYNLYFSEDCWAALEADSTAPDGGTWRDYVGTLGWNT